MEQLSRARQLYRDILGKKKESDVASTIQAGEDLKKVQELAGWKRIEAFMDLQESGSDKFLDIEMGTISLLTIPRLFSTFLKYLYVVMERRAYNKIRNFVRITIQTGEKYAERRAKAEASKTKS